VFEREKERGAFLSPWITEQNDTTKKSGIRSLKDKNERILWRRIFLRKQTFSSSFCIIGLLVVQQSPVAAKSESKRQNRRKMSWQ
jgi:hypothetical protein